MIPTSEQIEAFFERLRDLDRALAKLNGAKIQKAETLELIRTFSKDWLRLSECIRAVGVVEEGALSVVDLQMKGLLEHANSRTRSSTYRNTLAPVLASYTDKIVIPVIRFEGSPSQVTSRQLMEQFEGLVSPDEQNYVDEAARCLASQCNRAALILLWAGATARFHRAIERLGFNAYNAAIARARQTRGHPFSKVCNTDVASLPELQRCRDFDLLVLGMELWKYDLQVFEELDRLLGIRNSAAHPGMLRPTALDVQQYALKLKTYVFEIIPA